MVRPSLPALCHYGPSLLRATFVALILVICVGCGLSESAKIQFKTKKESVGRKIATFNEDVAFIKATSSDYPFVFDKVFDSWQKRIEKRSEFATGAEKNISQAEAIITADDADQEKALLKHLVQAEVAIDQALSGVAPMKVQAETVVFLNNNKDKSIALCASAIKTIDAVDWTGVEDQISRASLHWPSKANDLQEKFSSLQKRREEVVTAQQAINNAYEQDSRQVDWLKMAGKLNMVREETKLLPTDVTGLQALCEQLYISWQEILVDMEIKEGATVTFSHQIKKVVEKHRPQSAPGTEDEPPQSLEPERTESTNWSKVNKQTYLAHEKHLGMALRWKEAGKYDSEAQSIPQPPGYQYVSQRGRRSHYGYWHGSHWRWFSPYRSHGSYFWGNSYNDNFINERQYRSYSNDRDRGRTWFGSAGASFGSNGSTTMTQYPQAKYTKTQGFRSTRFKKSGGTYRGSKFSSSSSSSSGFRSSSSSGSRSFGGK